MNHLDFEQLVDYWLGDGDKVEEHLFACAECTARLEWLAALSDGVRAAVRAGAFGMVIPAPLVAAMKRAGMRLREYHTDPGATVSCTFRAGDDAVVSHIRARLGGVKRVDALWTAEVDGIRQPVVRLEDVPFDPAAEEVILLPHAAQLKKMPKHTMRLRLVAVEEAGERRLGEYFFDHTPS